MELLHEMGAHVDYADPHVPQLELNGRTFRGVRPTPAALRRYDCAILTTAHGGFDYDAIWKHTALLVDTRNAFRDRRGKKLVRL